LKIEKKKTTIVLAHYYQESDIQDVADYGVVLWPSRLKKTADIIVFAGVHFMAETAKILNPSKKCQT
jgi:quinolinate synthase